MRIERIETFQSGDRWLFVEITTDTGITGVGEAGLWGYPQAARAVIDSFKQYLIGQDPLRIEHHWQYLYRNAHFRGAAICGALAGIDIALWDIAGKHYGAPVYQLLGGRCRDKVRVYIHIGGETPEALAESARRAVQAGFTAVRFTPFPREYWNLTYQALLESIVQRCAAVYEAVGKDADLCIEIHRRLSPAEAVALAQELAKFRPLFYEDPILPDSIQSMAAVAVHCPVPIATGERLHTLFEFRELLERGGAAYIRPDVCLAGGLTHCKKIAAVAESYHVGVIPHNPLSPVSTAACVQLDACIPNFTLQEYTGEDRPPKSEIVRQPLRLEKGYLIVPDTPGIGVELNHAALERYPARQRPLDTPIRADGSVADQ
jgi:galactonate dehydratase